MKFDDISNYSDVRTRQAWQLQKEISKLQREIKTLSARQSRSVRADMAEMLSTDTPQLSKGYFMYEACCPQMLRLEVDHKVTAKYEHWYAMHVSLV